MRLKKNFTSTTLVAFWAGGLQCSPLTLFYVSDDYPYGTGIASEGVLGETENICAIQQTKRVHPTEYPFTLAPCAFDSTVCVQRSQRLNFR